MPLIAVYLDWNDLDTLQTAAKRDQMTPKEWIKAALMERLKNGKRLSPQE